MKVIIIGYGSRGTVYSEIYHKGAQVVAACDIKRERLEFAKANHNLSDDMLFLDYKDMLGKGKIADLCVVATPDNMHKLHAIAAMEAGYDLQLEKPIACTVEDVQEIYSTAKRLNRKVFVCHVLRYAPFFYELKNELLTGKYGKVSTINLTENVAYWHQAHSYVRGNWRDTKTSSPMIVAKCCHDLDIVSWIANEHCNAVSSMGSLSFYTKKNAPDGSSDRCYNCKVKDSCVYNAETFYLGRLRSGEKGWPLNILATYPTEQNITEALKTGDYGRCVFKCDNNAVDHQITNVEFDSGITAHLTMTAFSEDSIRQIHVHCEKGEIFGDTKSNFLTCNIFGKSSKKIDINTQMNNDFGHGGGDYYLVTDIINSYNNSGNYRTSIDNSMQSHFIAFAAEQSRLKNGKLITL